MSTEENKAIIRAYVETLWNRQQVHRADELVAPDYIDHAAVPGQTPGLEGAKRKIAMYLVGVPDPHVTVDELVAEGDKVAVRRTYEGTHKDELLGIPPTGNRLKIEGISIFRLAGGKIAEQWEQLDLLALMQQIGALPTPGRTTP